MRSKPGMIIVLSMLQALAPFGNVLVGAMLSEMNIREYLIALPNTTYGYEFLYSLFAVQFFTAYAIYAVKPWSIPVCIATTVWHISKMPSLKIAWSNPWIMPTLLLCHAINIGFIFYFLIPAVRKVYFNKRLRWWESIPRYVVNAKGVLLLEDKMIACSVDEFSRVGAFISLPTELHIRDKLVINFSYEGHEYFLKAKVLNQHLTNKNQFGLLFLKKDQKMKKEIMTLVNILEKSKAIRIPERINQIAELKTWAKEVIKTGHGFVPEYRTSEWNKFGVKNMKQNNVVEGHFNKASKSSNKKAA